MNIRRASAEDILKAQNCGLLSQPDNAHARYYRNQILSWPELSYVAEDSKGNVIGYVMGKMDEGHGHISNLSIRGSYRRQGLAQKLMDQVSKAMVEVYSAKYVTLNVRSSNRASLHLYQNALGFQISETQSQYYVNGDDAYTMKRPLQKFAIDNDIKPYDKEAFFAPSDINTAEGTLRSRTNEMAKGVPTQRRQNKREHILKESLDDAQRLIGEWNAVQKRWMEKGVGKVEKVETAKDHQQVQDAKENDECRDLSDDQLNGQEQDKHDRQEADDDVDEFRRGKEQADKWHTREEAVPVYLMDR